MKNVVVVCMVIVIVVGLYATVRLQIKQKKGTATSNDVNPNQTLIERFIESGSDLDKEHVVEFAFYGEWSEMNKIKDILLAQSYVQDTSQTDEMLIMTKKMKLNFVEIDKETEKMVGLGEQFNVVFDGWSAAIVKKN